MTDYINPEIPWDDDNVPVDEGDFQTIYEIGSMQYLGPKKVVMYGTGVSIELDYIMPDGSKFSRGGMREGPVPKEQLELKEDGTPKEKNTTAFFIAHELTTKDGEEYTTVIPYLTLPTIPVEKPDNFPFIQLNDNQKKALAENGVCWCSVWGNFQKQALKAMPAKARDDFGKGKKVHYKAETKVVRKSQVGEKTYRDKYRHTFKIFASHDEMIAARSGTNNSTLPNVQYPITWGKGVQVMLDYAKGEKIKEDFAGKGLDFSDDKVLAEQLQLTLDGIPANMADGNPCDVRKIMADIRNCPEALVKV